MTTAEFLLFCVFVIVVGSALFALVHDLTAPYEPDEYFYEQLLKPQPNGAPPMSTRHMTPEMISHILKWVMSGEAGCTMASGNNMLWEKNPIDMTDVEIIMFLAEQVKEYQEFVAELSFAIFLSKAGVQARKEGKPLPTKEEVVAYIEKVEKDVQAVLSLTQDKTNEMLSKTLKKRARQQ